MKFDLMKCIFAATVTGPASCTDLCQTVGDLGAKYSAVQPVDKTTYYRHGGKSYVKGLRYDYRRTFVDHPYAIRKRCCRLLLKQSRKTDYI